MTTGLQAHIFIILCTDLAKLKGGSHLTVQLILLFSDSDVLIRRGDEMMANIRVVWISIRVKVAKENTKKRKVKFEMLTLKMLL